MSEYGMHRLFYTVLPLVVLVGGCESKGPAKDWVAAIDTFRGNVLVAQRAGAPLRPAHQGLYLQVGSRLETGQASEAVLILRNGGMLTVKPNSLLVLSSRRPGSVLNLSLEQGAILGEGSKVEASELTISVGKRRIRLGSAARATVSVAGHEQGVGPNVSVTYGKALVIDPEGEVRTLVAGNTLVLTAPSAPGEPDAGPPEPDVGPEEVTATTITFYLQSMGKGRVLIRRPTDRRFIGVRRGQIVEVGPGTRIKLLRGARVRFGPQKGTGTMLTGPGLMVVTEDNIKSAETSRLRHVQGEIRLTDRGLPGKEGSSYRIEGVTIFPRITYRELDIRIQRKGDRSLVVVRAGRAKLVGKEQTVELEAGQQATLSKGSISGPSMPAPSPFLVQQFGTVRVFVNDRLPVTFRWPKAEGNPPSLVQVARSPSMVQPLFADVIRRSQLTLLQAQRGSLYWRVSTVGPDGKPSKPQRGHLLMVRDTSYRVLKNYRAPQNTIQHSFGDTVVYYQNRLPRFTFRWEPMPGASSYQLKILREQNLSQPLVKASTRKTSYPLDSGKLGEGNYLWYVVGRAADNGLVRSLKSYRLSIRYDNATPDLQIVFPRNGMRAAQDSIEARGVTIPGSNVFINGTQVELDRASRFTHQVALKTGTNYIIFRVEVPRRGSSYYLRRVVRR